MTPTSGRKKTHNPQRTHTAKTTNLWALDAQGRLIERDEWENLGKPDVFCPGHDKDGTPCNARLIGVAKDSRIVVAHFRTLKSHPHISGCDKTTTSGYTLKPRDIYKAPAGPDVVPRIPLAAFTPERTHTTRTSASREHGNVILNENALPRPFHPNVGMGYVLAMLRANKLDLSSQVLVGRTEATWGEIVRRSTELSWSDDNDTIRLVYGRICHTATGIRPQNGTPWHRVSLEAPPDFFVSLWVSDNSYRLITDAVTNPRVKLWSVAIGHTKGWHHKISRGQRDKTMSIHALGGSNFAWCVCQE